MNCRAREAGLLGWRKALLAGTALTAVIALPLALSGPATADGGRGGSGFFTSPGGAGGSGPDGGDGQPGSYNGLFEMGGGGGGGGAGGGIGGAGSPGSGGGPGGAGGAGGTGTAPGLRDGANGLPGPTTDSGGGGGGGGFNGFDGALPNNAASLLGGNGGNGGNGNDDGGGGGGGEGGYGANVAGPGTSTNSGTIRGGNGGAGAFADGGDGGSGGAGGIGLFFGAAGATLNNTGAINGGNGGAAGPAFFGDGATGAGGAGVVGSGLAIDNQGTIAGGLSGNGTTRAFGIVFTGGVNSVGNGGTISGGIHVRGGSFAPALSTSPVGTASSFGGPLTFESGTQYVVRVSPTASDSATVTGVATLTGASVNAQFTPGAATRQFTILTASGGFGGTQFAGATGNLANFATALDYQGNDVLLLLTAQLGSAMGALTVNQQNVATSLNNYFNAGGTLPPAFATLFGLTGDALRNALSQASGEPGASVSTSTFMAWNSFFNMIFDPFAQNRGGFGGGAMPFAAQATAQSEEVRLAYAAVTPKGIKRDLKDMPITKAPALADPFAPRWSVWGGGYGGSATTEGNAQIGSHDTTSRAYGFAAGADHRLAPDTLIGFALAGGGTSFDLDQGLGGGTSDLFQASVYARQNWGAAYLMGAFGYGWQDFTLNRTVTIAGTDKLEADFNAHSLAGRAEGGWRFGSALAGMTPYAAVQVASLDLPAYSERAKSGSDTFALSYAGRTDTQTRSELGARFDYAMPMQTALLTLRGRAAWAHDYDNDRIANAGFMALPGTAFIVNGARPDADALLVSAGAELALLNGLSLAGSFEGEFSGNTESYAGKGAIRYRW